MPDDPLWSRRGPPADPERAISTVHAFLRRCRAWGVDREIPSLLERLSQEPTPQDAAKLHQWTTWVSFVDHAMEELEAGTLDPWFDEL